MPAYKFDPAHAWLRDPDMFVRFNVTGKGIPLAKSKLNPDDELLVIERGGERRAFLQTELAYHHGAQGELAGEPYLVSY